MKFVNFVPQSNNGASLNEMMTQLTQLDGRTLLVAPDLISTTLRRQAKP